MQMRTLLIFLLFVSIAANVAFACSCEEPKAVNEKLKQSDAVFLGKVLDVHRTLFGFGFDYKVKFEVEQTWKGISDKIVTVRTGLGAGDCGYNFEENKVYLVYSVHGKEYYGEPLSTSICSGTKEISYAQKDLQELGIGTKPHPTKRFDLTLVSVVILTLLCIMTFLLKMRGRSKRLN